MHALLDEYFTPLFFKEHTIVQLGGFDMRGYAHADLDGFDSQDKLCMIASKLSHKNALALVLSNIPCCLDWLLGVGFKGKTVVVGRFDKLPLKCKAQAMRGKTTRFNLLGEFRVVLLANQAAK
jgi:hypothetical protein